MLARLRRAFWPLALALASIAGVACGLFSGEAPKPGEVEAKAAARAQAAHAKAGNTACSTCHEAEHKDPGWRLRAMRIGHDVAVNLKEKTSCTCCHLGKIEGFGPPVAERCKDCHQDIHVTIPAMAETHCLACHDLTSGQDIRLGAWECQKCHASDAVSEAPAIDVHGDEPCEACHQPHDEPWVIEQRCSDCHGGKEHVAHGDPARAQQLVCRDCHNPHEKAGEASGRCVPCHQKKDAPGTFATTIFQGHDACTNCHAPHGFEKSEAKRCPDCHQEKQVTEGPAAHRDCQSCHATHAPRDVSAETCTKCHDKVAVNHAGGSTEACTTCHDPHAGSKSHPSGVASCSSCHAKIGENDHAHFDAKVGCETCHKPHAFLAGVAPKCGSCHAAEAQHAAKHTDCTNCHGDAHTTHAGSGACASCHAKESSTLTAGHGPCNQCHDAHQATLLPKAAECTSCHAQKAAGPHRSLKGGCQSCHRAHGPEGQASPPACTSCHTAPNQAGGMHAVAGHAECTQCHSSHAPPDASRKTCLGCHTDRQSHEPQAKVCTGCHTFKGF